MDKTGEEKKEGTRVGSKPISRWVYPTGLRKNFFDSEKTRKDRAEFGNATNTSKQLKKGGNGRGDNYAFFKTLE